MTTRVGVVGAAGRMGRAVCAAVASADDLDLVAAVAPRAAGQRLDMAGGRSIEFASDLRAFADSGAEVVVDFSVAAASRVTVPWLAMHGVHAVVGTTGLTASDLDDFSHLFTGSNCIVAANFAVSAVLMMRFAELAAPWFDTAEIIELHHDAKLDAPSGTAMVTAGRMAAASPTWAPDQTRDELVDGARGALGPAGIRMHSVRMRGMVAHQEIVLGAEGQTLTIRQDSYDRSSYMPGVLLACRAIGDHAGVTIGLDSLLGV